MAAYFVLRAMEGDFLATFAMKCSSFVMVNRGTSQRSACNAIGNLLAPSVVYSNKLLERQEQPKSPINPVQFPWYM